MPAVVERTPFVGRESERADLRRLLDQAIRGQGALVMIGGEPGVGKTRLAEELLLEAGQRGILAWTGHCYEMEGAPPYVPFVEILETAARVIPAAALRDALGDSAPEVARLMPGLRRLFPDIPPPLELPPEQERRYLFNSFQEFLERVARVQAILLVLEDLHWADDATLLLLQHITQRLHEMPVLIVGTYRDVELDVGRPLARVLEELLRQRLAHRVALRRLPETGVAAMLEVLSGQAPPVPLVQTVYGETEGNPFFVEEVFQHLTEEGRLFDEEGRWRSGLRVSELNVPEGVRLVIGRRLERVCEDCRRVLTIAAVIGRGFSFELLEALGDVSADALLDAVDEAERAHLITSTADGPEARFTFAHELIRQTLVSGLSLPRRQRRHLRVAEAMERLYARTLEEHAAELAHHFYQAGSAADAEKTVRYLALAGDQAMEAAAFEDALRHYDDALSLQPADDQRGRADLLYKRGLALHSLGRWEEALADWLEATFGQTLCEHFFGPFHERYTAGLSRHIAPQDGYKTPFDLARVQRGLTGKGTNAGYNTFFHYPRRGLQHVADHMAAGARLQTGCRIVSVKPAQHELLLDNGSGARYQTLLSTLPLNRTAALMGLDPEEDPWPATAVLVLNLGAARGPACPDEHWIYVPNSRSGFFRVGFYSNVDNRFLPAAAEGKVSLYVERAFAEGARPSEEEVAVYTASAMAELREWGFIGEPEAVSRTWVDVAYTWARPGSQWRERTLAALEQRGVFMTGRYARWRFEGIAESIRDGFAAGAALRPSRP